jgi:DNA-binding MarR family transcriptional regulator
MNNERRYSEADELNLKMVIALLRSVKALEAAMTPCFKERGVTFTQFGVLEFLYHKGPARISTIIEKTLSSGGCMTVVIRNLESLGLVARERDEKDGRAALVALTPKGQALMRELFPAHLKELKAFMAAMDGKDKKAVAGLLKGLQRK